MTVPNQQPPAEEQLVETRAFEAEVFWHQNKNLILTVVGVVVLAALVAFLWIQHDRSQKAASEALYASATDIAGWQKVIAEYPKSQAAANASFLLAAAQRDAGDVAGSSATYQKFLDDFPKHTLAPAASLGLAENLALQGKDSEALTQLRQIQAGGSPAYVASYAAFAEGRILLLQGKPSDARKIFQSVLQTYPSTPPASLAGQLLQQIDLLYPAAPAPAPAATPAQ